MIPSVIDFHPNQSATVSGLGDSSSSFGTSFLHDEEQENSLCDDLKRTFVQDTSAIVSPRNNRKSKKKKVIKVRAMGMSPPSSSANQPPKNIKDMVDTKQLGSLLQLLTNDRKIVPGHHHHNHNHHSERCCECDRPVSSSSKQRESDRAPQKPKRRNSDDHLPLERLSAEKKSQYIKDLGITDEMINGLKRVGLHITEC